MNDEKLEHELDSLIRERDELLEKLDESDKKIKFYNRKINRITSELEANIIVLAIHPISANISSAAVNYSSKKQDIQVYKSAKQYWQDQKQDILETIDLVDEQMEQKSGETKNFVFTHSLRGSKQ